MATTSTVAAAPNPAATGVTLTVHTGDGANFPPDNFDISVFPAGDSAPYVGRAELVRVLSRAGDVFTIERQWEGSASRAILNGDNISTLMPSLKPSLSLTVGAADPGQVGAGNQWVDTSGPRPILKVRKADDSGWQTQGVITLQKTAPADGDLAASEFALWLDDTIGATKLKVKAKDSAGTVVAGTINLA